MTLKQKIVIVLLSLSTIFFAILALFTNSEMTKELNEQLFDYALLEQSYENVTEDCEKAIEIIEMLRHYANEEEQKIIEEYYQNKSRSVEEFVDEFEEDMNQMLDEADKLKDKAENIVEEQKQTNES